MHVIMDLCVVPMGVGLSVSKYVAACERVLAEAGLKAQLHAYGTNIEGEWDAVMAAVRRCHEVIHEMGAPAHLDHYQAWYAHRSQADHGRQDPQRAGEDEVAAPALREFTMSLPGEQSESRSWAGVLALFLCAALWSLNGPLIKLLDAEHVPGITIACYRSLVGGVVFLPLAWRRLGDAAQCAAGVAGRVGADVHADDGVLRDRHHHDRGGECHHPAIHVARSGCSCYRRCCCGSRPGRTEGLVLLVAMAGVGVIFFGNAGTDTAGLVVALGSGLGYGALTVALRGLRRVDPFVVAAMNALGSGLLLLLPALAWGSFAMTGRALWLVLLISLVQFTLPYVLFSWALQRVEAHRAALIVLLETVLNPLWTYLFIGEPVPRPTLLGGPLILLSVAGWVVLTRRRARPARRSPPA